MIRTAYFLKLTSAQQEKTYRSDEGIFQWCEDRGYLFHSSYEHPKGAREFHERAMYMIFPDEAAAFEFKMRWL